MAQVFTVIGDLVGSRRVGQRAALQAEVSAALDFTSGLVAPLDRLETTVGDEFQGVYAGLGDATLATMVIRLRLSATIDVRCGIGCGDREVFAADRRPMLQDGPAWWSARAAIDSLGLPANRLRRTWFDGRYLASDLDAVTLANAFLVSRDALVDRLGPRGRSLLLLALQGRSQREIAQLEKISESAVSQAFAKGVGAARDAQLMVSTLVPRPPTSDPPTPSP